LDELWESGGDPCGRPFEILEVMKLSAKRKKEIKREVEKVVTQLKKLGAKKIILFGSLAKGNLRVGSDIDLVALFEDQDTFKSRMRRIYAQIDCTEDVDILTYNFQEFERIKKRAFFRHVLKEGKVIYEA